MTAVQLRNTTVPNRLCAQSVTYKLHRQSLYEPVPSYGLLGALGGEYDPYDPYFDCDTTSKLFSNRKVSKIMSSSTTTSADQRPSTAQTCRTSISQPSAIFDKASHKSKKRKSSSSKDRLAVLEEKVACLVDTLKVKEVNETFYSSHSLASPSRFRQNNRNFSKERMSEIIDSEDDLAYVNSARSSQ
ncbi:uncharacterized protein LOC105840317 [Monomorium pharaonis]|uniref:uncharacterized protein LOC105840317 n=1 Tax=Monomorium pharaonis TaxID=307658 RepID=UPI00063FBDE8|nr:uncharacterized protein LOC105840317 [Monomorium pharaonis]